MISVTLKNIFIAVVFLSNQVYMQQSIYENIPINSIVIRPGQEYKPQNYNSYSCYQFGSYGQPESLGEIVYYPHLVPESLRSEEEYATLHNSPGDSCSSTVCASVYYNFEREKPEFENNSDCMCNNSGNKHKSSNCTCNKSTCCNSEYRCNKQKYDCESSSADFCISRSELDGECSRYSCFEKPIYTKCEQENSRCTSKCGCGEPN